MGRSPGASVFRESAAGPPRKSWEVVDAHNID